VKRFRLTALLIALLASVAVLRTVQTYATTAQGFDEPCHISAALEWLDRHTYTLDPVHPPLARAAIGLPLLFTGERYPSLPPDDPGTQNYNVVGNHIIYSSGHFARTLALARSGMLPFLVLEIVLVFLWARREFGDLAGVLAAALKQARDARLHILDVMAEAIDGPDEMSPFAPRVTVVKIPVDKIGAVIGPKGQMINGIQDETGADITIEDDGTIYVGAADGASAQAAVDKINAIANPQLPKVGERFLGTVVKTAAFGAFVSLLPGRDGLVHISKLGQGKRIGKVEDVVKVGDKLQVEIADIDQRGKISLVLVREDASGSAPVAAATIEPVEADTEQ